MQKNQNTFKGILHEDKGIFVSRGPSDSIVINYWEKKHCGELQTGYTNHLLKSHLPMPLCYYNFQSGRRIP